jgi:hypothetical protein
MVTVTLAEDRRLALESGDHVKFSELTGAEELNAIDPVPIKVLSRFTFSVDVPGAISEHIKGGRVTEVRIPKVVAFVCIWPRSTALWRHLHMWYSSWQTHSTHETDTTRCCMGALEIAA